MTKQKPILNQEDLKILEKKFATKDDLKTLATKTYIDTNFLTKDEFGDFKEELDQKLFNYRSDIMNKVDEVLTELRASRDEQTTLSHRVSVHTDQINRIEKELKLPAFD